MKGTMNIYEIEEHAKEHGFNSLEFIMINKHGEKFNGKFLDAYYGFIQVPELGEGFIRLNDLIVQFGFDFFTFVPLTGVKEYS